MNPHLDTLDAPERPSSMPFGELLAEGTVLEGRYEIGPLLGEGSAGYAVEARHVVLGARLVLKIMRPEHTADAEAVARFRREAQIVASLGHPHIVDVRDFGELRDAEGRSLTTYFVMEYLDGRDLSQALFEDGPFEVARAVRVILQMADALAAAHDCGIIHRDVKPANVLLLRQGAEESVKMLDFGIAKLDSARVTRSGHVLGTPAYMAPEQAQGRDVDARADVYALCVVLYELLTGTVPLDDPQPLALLRKVIAEPAPSVAAARPDLPAALVALIDGGLSKSRDDRPPSMRALARELEAVLKEPRTTEGSPRVPTVQARSSHAGSAEVAAAPPAQAPTPRAARSRIPVLGAALGMLGVIAIGVVAMRARVVSPETSTPTARVAPSVPELVPDEPRPARVARSEAPPATSPGSADASRSTVVEPSDEVATVPIAPRVRPPEPTRARRVRREAPVAEPEPVEPAVAAPAPAVDRSAIDPWY